MPVEPMDIRIGDVYTLRKPHPCGSYDWRVVRVGGDIGMRCVKCDHKVLLPRSEFERRSQEIGGAYRDRKCDIIHITYCVMRDA